MIKISVLVASRKRPELLKQMFYRCMSMTKFQKEVEWIVRIDDDDVESHNICSEIKKDNSVKDQFHFITGPIMKNIMQLHSDCYNTMRSDIFMLSGDDIAFQTYGWDEIVLNEFEKYDDKIVLVYGNDGHQHEKIAVTPFLHRNWIKSIGGENLLICDRPSADRWLTDVSILINRKVYLPEVKFSHLWEQYNNDETSNNRKNQRNSKVLHKKYYARNMRKDRQREMFLLKEFIENFKK
jgi:hypothetical protein